MERLIRPFVINGVQLSDEYELDVKKAAKMSAGMRPFQRLKFLRSLEDRRDQDRVRIKFETII